MKALVFFLVVIEPYLTSADWTRHGQFLYDVAETAEHLNFTDVESRCNNLDSTLAIVKTYDVYNFLLTEIDNLHLTSEPYSFFIGLKRKMDGGQFYWSDGTNTTSGETFWAFAEPNNYPAPENCVIMGWPHATVPPTDLAAHYKWSDVSCATRYTRYICQKFVGNFTTAVMSMNEPTTETMITTKVTPSTPQVTDITQTTAKQSKPMATTDKTTVATMATVAATEVIVATGEETEATLTTTIVMVERDETTEMMGTTEAATKTMVATPGGTDTIVSAGDTNGTIAATKTHTATEPIWITTTYQATDIETTKLGPGNDDGETVGATDVPEVITSSEVITPTAATTLTVSETTEHVVSLQSTTGLSTEISTSPSLDVTTTERSKSITHNSSSSTGVKNGALASSTTDHRRTVLIALLAIFCFILVATVGCYVFLKKRQYRVRYKGIYSPQSDCNQQQHVQQTIVNQEEEEEVPREVVNPIYNLDVTDANPVKLPQLDEENEAKTTSTTTSV